MENKKEKQFWDSLSLSAAAFSLLVLMHQQPHVQLQLHTNSSDLFYAYAIHNQVKELIQEEKRLF